MIAMLLIGCSSNADTDTEDAMTADNESVVNQDTFVEFKSQLGNTIVYPSQWTPKDKGDAFSLASPDGQAVINALTFTAEGTGTLAEFQDMMVSQIDGDGAIPKWTDIDIGGITAQKRQLDSRDEDAESSWRVYVLQNGECYHAIFLNASTLVMDLNGGFYENVIRSFKGISTVP